MKKHLGKARYPLIVILALVTLSLVVFEVVEQSRRARASLIPQAPTSAQVTAALMRAGLDAEALAAAGLSAPPVGNVVDDVADWLAADQADLELADSAYASARIQCDQLKRAIQSGQATEEQTNAYPTATSQFAQAHAECAALLDAAFDAGTADLSQSQRATLAVIRGNRRWKVPLEFLLVDRTEAEWVQLRDCLANERIAADLENEDPDPQAQALLAQLRSDPLVSAAAASLDANAAVIADAWEQAIADMTP